MLIEDLESMSNGYRFSCGLLYNLRSDGDGFVRVWVDTSSACCSISEVMITMAR